MDKPEVIISGRKSVKHQEIPAQKSRKTNIFTSATAIVAAGAIFCIAFLGKYIDKKDNNVSNHSFEAVYAMAQVDTVPTNSSDSVLTGSMEDGEWSIWAYLEYVISKFIGVS